MRSLALTADRRLFIDNLGNIATVSSLAAVLQNCETAMRAQLGEMYYNADQGVPTRATVWDNYNPLQFMAAGRVTLQNVQGVQRVISFDVDRIGDLLTYTATIQTIYGPGVVTNVQ
jgi:hypothetical protein